MKKSLFIVLLMALTVLFLSCSKTEKNNNTESSGDNQEIVNTEENNTDKQEIIKEKQKKQKKLSNGNTKYSLYKLNNKYGLIDSERNIVLEANFDEIKYNEVYLCTNEGSESFIYSADLELLHKFEKDQHHIIMGSPDIFYYKEGERTSQKSYLLSLPENIIMRAHTSRIEKGNSSKEQWIAGCGDYFKPDLENFTSIRPENARFTYPYRENRAVVVIDDYQKNVGWIGEIIDENFSVVLKDITGAATYYSEGLIPVIKTTGENCYVDTNGKVVYNCDFEFDTMNLNLINRIQLNLIIGSFVDGVAVVKAKDNKWIVLDKDFKKKYIPEEYTVGAEYFIDSYDGTYIPDRRIDKKQVYSYSNGLLPVWKMENDTKMYGYLDKDCNLAIPCIFTDAEPFVNGYAIVKYDDKDAIVDVEGNIYLSNNMSVPCNLTQSGEEYSVFKQGKFYGLINQDRKIILEPIYDNIVVNSNSIISKRGEIREIFNKSLKSLYVSDLPFAIKYYTEKDILLRNLSSNNFKLLNLETGELTNVSGKNYSAAFGYRDNVSLIYNYPYTIENINGDVILADIHQAHPIYTDGMLAVILKNGKSGFVNKNGVLVIETSFYIEPDDVGPRTYPIIRYFFKNDYALVKNEDKKWVQIAIDGTEIFFPENIEPADYCYENNLVPIIDLETKKYGYMNTDFKIVIPCNFSYAKSFVEGYAIVKYEDKDAIVDVKGNIYLSEDMSVPYYSPQRDEEQVDAKTEYQLTTEPKVLPAGTDGSSGISGTYVLFGDWPQSVKEDNVQIDESATVNVNGWDCYKGSDGCYYVKEIAKPVYNDRVEYPVYSNGTIIENETEYYFKIEPIKWRVLNDDPKKGKLLLAENVLLPHKYYTKVEDRVIDGEIISDLNYQYSSIRAYLNGLDGSNYGVEDFTDKGFINKAFTKEVSETISTSAVFSEGEFTKDKIFLLAEKDLTNNKYGFSTDRDAKDFRRERKLTDYSRALGVCITKNSDTGSWWTRTTHPAGGPRNGCVYSVTGDGIPHEFNSSDTPYTGVVPALYIMF